MAEPAEPQRMALVGEVAGSVLLLCAAIWLPWATVRTSSVHLSLRGGPLDWALIVIACASLSVVAALCVAPARAGFFWTEVCLGGLAVVCALGLALTKIADANHHVAALGSGDALTAFGIGSLLGLAAAILMVTSSIMMLLAFRKANDPRLREESGTSVPI